MPKKRTGKALLIKPGSQAAIASSASQHQNDATRPSVNDLIRESRRAHLREQSVPSQPLPSSVPPQVRDVLNLPTPTAPTPRPGIRRVRPTPIPHSDQGPSRIRTVPGPPPPKSWLIDSRHAPAAVAQDEYQSMRRLDTPVFLPGASFPRLGSLLHCVLKEMAVNWEWHVFYDAVYLRDIPVKLREALLSYIAIYSDDVESNPLRMLFTAAVSSEGDPRHLFDEANSDLSEVTRLDLSCGLGNWTRLKQLEKDLFPFPQAWANTAKDNAAEEIPDSWNSERMSPSPPLRIGLVVPNLKHLSMAVNPSNSARTTNNLSWKALLQLCTHLTTLESLSLAHWPQPTYTPVAAQTNARVTIAAGTGSSPRVNFGGTTMYSRLDGDFRESAGILRSLSQKLHSLTWLDLTGCSAWWDALYWRPNPAWPTESAPDFSEDDHERQASYSLQTGSADSDASQRTATAGHAPDWNGVWRSVVHIGLKIGYTPIDPDDLETPDGFPAAGSEWERSGSQARKNAVWHREKNVWDDLKKRQDDVVRSLRAIRRSQSGKWIEFDL